MIPDRVRIVEVGPRDGLQNEAHPVPVEARIAFIEALADAGLQTIEAGSFVSPRWVPQMAGTAEVLRGLRSRAGVCYPVLVPNMTGFDAAQAAGAREIAVFAAASESFSQRNINCSVAQSLARFRPVCDAALAAGSLYAKRPRRDHGSGPAAGSGSRAVDLCGLGTQPRLQVSRVTISERVEAGNQPTAEQSSCAHLKWQPEKSSWELTVHYGEEQLRADVDWLDTPRQF